MPYFVEVDEARRIAAEALSVLPLPAPVEVAGGPDVGIRVLRTLRQYDSSGKGSLTFGELVRMLCKETWMADVVPKIAAQALEQRAHLFG